MPRKIIGILLALLGIAVFVIRLKHGGPYFLPEGGNLLGGLLALICGALWFVDPLPEEGRFYRLLHLGLLVASLLGLYLAAFATAAEVEEVIVVWPGCQEARGEPLRLWVIDDEGAAWATLGREKAVRAGLPNRHEARLLRGGVETCVDAALVDDARVVEHLSLLREEKYAVERVAVALGIFGEDRFDSNVALRLRLRPSP